MEASRRRYQHPDRIRRQLATTAADLLTRDGMRWTMDQLARTTGVSRGLLYRLYAGRAEVLSTVLDRPVTDDDIRVLTSVRWGEYWRPTTVEDWRHVHALLCRGDRHPT